jgi:hypothetical protein
VRSLATIVTRGVGSYTQKRHQVTFTTYPVSGGLKSAIGHDVNVTLDSADTAFLLEAIVDAFGAGNVISTIRAIEAKAGQPGRIMTAELEGTT